MAGTDNMNNARVNNKDEFYTQLSDIENELRHYKEHFKGKTVLCNCDDPYESNFFKYFAMNFNHLQLKKLIATCYATSTVMHTQLALFDDMQETFEVKNPTGKKPYKVEITEVTDENSDGAFDLEDIKTLLKSDKNVCSVLEGDGDFRSPECIEFLKEADIVVTNPPFSLFNPYVQQLFQFNKKFIIMGTVNNTHYKEIFPLFKENKMWVGYSFNKTMTFNMPETYKGTTRDSDGRKIGKVPSICWFTNLEIKKRHEKLILYKKYTPEEYPKYDNYDAIDVGKVSLIPCDYFGLMGVPDTFLDSYNPDQFEIVASCQTGCHPDEMVLKTYKDYVGYKQNGKPTGRTGSTCGHNAILVKNDGKHDYYKNAEGVIVQSAFSRIFIKRKDQPL